MGLAEQLLTRFKRGIASLKLVPSDGGRFEVSVGGDLVYSKESTGRFPNDGEVEKILAART